MNPQSIELKTQQETDHIALRGVRVRAELRAMTLRAQVEQTFVNAGPKAVEATYTFPLPDGAAVCGFEIVTGDRVITGKLEEFDKAILMYGHAIGRGDGAYALEQVRPDVFTVLVGNLKPKQAATVRLTYLKELQVVDRGVRLALPTTVAPRYISQAGTDPLEAMIAGDELNPPHAMDVPYGLTLEMDVDLGVPLKSLTSASHAVQAKMTSPDRWHVTFAGGTEQMDRDVVLQLDLTRSQQPCAQRCVGPRGEQFVAVTFVPEFADEDLSRAPEPTETVFLIDCSGSMEGPSIQQAKTALELCLRSLNRGDTFNICRFGSTFEFFAAQPVAYDEATMSQAAQYVRAMDADLGGTEVHVALNEVLRQIPGVGMVRQVIMLTDGQVSNEPAVVALAKRHAAGNRIFTFGIGSAASARLVNGMAEMTGGASEFISDGERIDEKVLRTFGRMASPRVSEIEVDWGSAGVVTQSPAVVPAVFDGDAVTVMARVAGDLPSTLSLRCQTATGLHSWQVAVPSAGRDGGMIATAWARRALAEGESRGWSRAALVALSQEFGVLCSATTFLAVEHRSIEERNDGRPEFRRVPVMVPADQGSEMLREMARPVRRCCSVDVSAMSEMRPRRSGRMASGGSVPGDALPRPSAPISADALMVLLSWQTSDGWFDAPVTSDSLGPGVWQALQDLRDECARRALALDGGASIDARTVDTLAVIAILERQFSDRRAIWNRAAGKATRWLARDGGLTEPAIEGLLKV